ncbi:shikimate kinase [Candidatus Vidania fulgoroideorum]
MLILTGFMNSGKTFEGYKLACILNLFFIDSDIFFKKFYNFDINIIIFNKSFRDKEKCLNNLIIKNNKKIILSLGGGFILLNLNLSRIIYKNVISVKTNLLYKIKRPLLKLNNIFNIYNNRKKIYEGVSKINFDFKKKNILKYVKNNT